MTDTSKQISDDQELANSLAPVLWEADEWWKANYQSLEPTADWAECILLHILPKLRAAFAAEALAKLNASFSTGATTNSAGGIYYQIPLADEPIAAALAPQPAQSPNAGAIYFAVNDLLEGETQGYILSHCRRIAKDWAAHAPQPVPMDERKAAENAYVVSAFAYERDPIGSRDWMQFYAGWMARAAGEVTPPDGK